MGVEWVKDDKDAKYLSLYQNMSLRNTLMPSQASKKYPKGLPYDYSCPSVKQDVIKRRLCSSCGLYFGTIKANTLHKASCRVTEVRTENVTERVRPMRIAARRQRELLCVMALQEMEWVSMDDVDIEDFDIENVVDAENEIGGTPIIDTDRITPIWSDDTEE